MLRKCVSHLRSVLPGVSNIKWCHAEKCATEENILAITTGERVETGGKGDCVSVSLAYYQDLVNSPCIVVCSSLLKLIIFIISDLGRCLSPRSGWRRQKRRFLIKVAGGKCPGVSALVLSIFMSDWREPVNIFQLLWLHLSNFGLCLWGLVYCLGSGLSSSPSSIQIWSRTCFLFVSPNSD